MSPAGNTREVFLLIGQSNMAGRGPLDAVPELRHPRVSMFRDGRWIPASEPLHNDRPAVAGIGLGMSFAVELAERLQGASIGLLPCAVGATALERWMPGADLHENAVAVTRQAAAGDSLKGILWHQGETDSHRLEDAEIYGERLSVMIASLRKDLDAPDVAFIAGELGSFLQNAGGHEFSRTVNRQLSELCDVIPHYACVSAGGLSDKGDNVHFDSPSLRELGKRYAREYLRICR